MTSQTTPVRAATNRDVINLFRRYLKPYWRLVVVLILCYFLVSFLTALQPLVMAPMLDIVTGEIAGAEATPLPDLENWREIDLNNVGSYAIAWLNQFEYTDWQIVWVMAGSYLLISVLLYLLNFGVYLLALWIRINSERDIQKDLFKHILSLSLDFFNARRTGELMSRLDQDTRASVYALSTIARSLVVSSTLVIIYGAMLLRTNAQLTVFILIAGILHYALTQAIRTPIRQRVRDQFNVMADTTAYLQETITNIRVVKSFVAEKYEGSRLQRLVQRLLSVNLRFGIFKNIDEPVSNIINSLTNVGILLLTTYQLFNGELTVSGFFIYLYVGRSMLGPVSDLTRTYTTIQTSMASSERVNDLFAQRTTVTGGEQGIGQLEFSIRFEGVTFRYGEEAVLRDISFEIPRGKITALVGPSGGGKSTLTDLLLRFYDPQAGKILIDDKDLRSLKLDQYRQMFGVVSQDPQLFNATIAENIAYPGLELSPEEVENAGQIANAHEFVTRLPQGYDSLIGDRGVLLSGGQRQRLAIARAISRTPQILILDEATSALDSESERVVQEAIDRVIRKTTSVIIAHRLSTVVHADQIVVLDQGELVDLGHHEELFERCDLYRHLCELQFAQ